MAGPTYDYIKRLIRVSHGLAILAATTARTGRPRKTIRTTGSAGSLTDAKRGEQPIEHALVVHAAGDFAERAMGLPGKTRMWRATPQPRRAGLGIVFTLDPAKQAEGAGISDFGAGPDDGSVSVSMAIASYCGLPFPFFRE